MPDGGEEGRFDPEGGGGHDGAHVRLALGGPHRPVAVRHLALDHRWPQIALADVVRHVHLARESRRSGVGRAPAASGSGVPR